MTVGRQPAHVRADERGSRRDARQAVVRMQRHDAGGEQQQRDRRCNGVAALAANGW